MKILRKIIDCKSSENSQEFILVNLQAWSVQSQTLLWTYFTTGTFRVMLRKVVISKKYFEKVSGVPTF